MRPLLAVALVSLPLSAAPHWPVVVPMTMEKNLPLIRMQVNGGPELVFVLDSAAVGCVIDGRRAAALGLKASADGISSGSGGLQRVGLIEGVRLGAGGLSIAPRWCETFDMSALKFQGRVEGIIGHPLFERYTVEIDYPGQRARFFDPRSYKPPRGAQVLPIRMTPGPVVRGSIRVRGRPRIDLDIQLDTGSAHVLTLCTPFVDRHRLLEAAADLEPGRTLGIGGGSDDIAGHILEVRIGRFAVQNALVRFARRTTGSFASERRYSANLGGEFMKRYRIAFDFRGSRIAIADPVVPGPPER